MFWVSIYFFTYYNVSGLGMARRYWKIPSSSFGVGQYPPRPSASPQDIGEGIAQPLRIQRVFSNTSSPCLCHCPSLKGYDKTGYLHELIKFIKIFMNQCTSKIHTSLMHYCTANLANYFSNLDFNIGWAISISVHEEISIWVNNIDSLTREFCSWKNKDDMWYVGSKP